MKSVIILLLCASVFVNAIDKALINEVMEKVQEYGIECAEAENPPPEDIEAMMNKKEPNTREGKCTLFCVFKKFNLMKEDNSFGPGYTEWLDKVKADDAEFYEKMMGVYSTCEEQVKSKDDGCERAFEFTVCLRAEGEKIGLDHVME